MALGDGDGNDIIDDGGVVSPQITMRRQGTSLQSRHLTLSITDGLRATQAAVPLSSFGRMLSVPLSAQSSSNNDYQYSFPVNELDEFWSHSWSGSAWQKTATLLLYYNAVPSMVVGVLGALWGGLVSMYFQLHTPFAWAFSPIIGRISFFAAIFGLRSQRRIFLDKVCIPQSDAALKANRIRSIGGFLSRSNSLLVLWDSSYATRLWCIFELAAYTHLFRNTFPKRIRIRPTLQGACVFICMVGLVPFELTRCWLTVAMHHDKRKVVVVQCVTLFVGVLPIAHLVRKLARDVDILSKQLEGFSVRKAECLCCSSNHRDSVTGEEIPCDRELVEASVMDWFGSLDAFDEFVHTEVKPMFRVQVGLPYRLALLIGSFTL
jgi:hypothetical protein